MDPDSPTVWRVVETKARARWGGRVVDVVTYVNHADHPDCDPDLNSDACEVSLYNEVKDWHAASRAELSLRPELQPPSGKFTLSFYDISHSHTCMFFRHARYQQDSRDIQRVFVSSHARAGSKRPR